MADQVPPRRPVGAFVRRMAAALAAPRPEALSEVVRDARAAVDRLGKGLDPVSLDALRRDDASSQAVRAYRLGRATLAWELAGQSLRTRPDALFMTAVSDPFAQLVLDALGEDEATSRAIARSLDVQEDDILGAMDALVVAGVLFTRVDGSGDTLYACTPEALASRLPLDAIEDDEPL